MENVNYYLKYLDELEIINKEEKKPTLLLHACCGPCSTAVLDELTNFFDITIYYYNPNIYPESEYEKRYDQFKLIPQVKLIEKCDYNDQEFYNAIKDVDNYDKLKEGGKRCYECYKLRLEKTCKYAKDNNFDYFSTTLSISPYKNSNWINEIGIELMEKYNIKFLYSNFKKKEGYKKSIAYSKEYGLYRQEYCGCKYSLEEMKNYLSDKEKQ